MKTVAIIGAGPAGLIAARYLKKEGFEPVVFEQGAQIGGQWTGDARYSGVWPSMVTNTPRLLTAFSDLPHEPATPIYPANQTICAYLQRYAAQFDLISHVRLNTCVQEIRRDPSGSGWLVRSQSKAGETQTATYAQVIVASGRYNKPTTPDVPGLESFTGRGGVSHAFAYKQPEQYRGQRVLVAGGAISALEIAADLAMLGAVRVVSTYRRQRYIISKVRAGVSAGRHTRFAGLAAESLPPDVLAEEARDFILRTSGSPEQFGALKPAATLSEAGVAVSQHFLPFVAEGRIIVKPWIRSIEGETVRFMDGSVEQVDAIIFGTGYVLHLPFLSPDLHQTLGIDAHHIDLYQYTFHPQTPGLAFMGLFELIGAGFPMLELQARWIAYVWGGAQPAPSLAEMEAGIADYQARRGGPQGISMSTLALLFAREAGVEPELSSWPALAPALLFGPLTSLSFRLSGRDSLPDAPQRIMAEAKASGAVPTGEFTAEQRRQLQDLAAIRNDAAFSQYVEQVTG